MNKPIEVDVLVSVTLSKTIKIKLDDYVMAEDDNEDGKYYYCDYDNCDFYEAVKDQIILPHNLAEVTKKSLDSIPKSLQKAITDCSDWALDDIEIIEA